MKRVGTLYLALALVAIGALVSSGLAPAQASKGSDPFVLGETYRGDFPDPWVLKSGDTYYAYSTNTANLNLPTVTSKDLTTWTAHGDAFPRVGRWARASNSGGRSVSRTWAPSVTFVKNHFVLAYTAPINGGGGRKNCIGLAAADAAEGPFSDGSSSPIVCPSDQGAIDPQVFVAEDGKPYLLWKNEGVVRREPTTFWVRQLRADGVGFADGSSQVGLLSTALSWEGHVIENPTMIRIQGLNYLFYSANEFVSDRYAIGYAICETVTGPCTRPSSAPLLSSGGSVSGPGGPAPFVGPDGQLRLAYAAWSLGRTGYPRSSGCRPGCNQRRLHVATLAIDTDGLIRVADRG